MQLCDDDKMEQLVTALSAGDADDLAQVERLLREFPQDPRLHFMRGSLLAAKKQAILAHEALSRAVELAPDYHIARYQLGFFELTSGEADAALATWGPLLRLPEEHYLRIFVEGMAHLIRDEFEAAMARFDEGIEANNENEPLNNDIRLLRRECEELARNAEKGTEGREAGGDDRTEEGLSATSLLLGGFSGRETKH